MSLPLISICVPAYKQPDYVRRLLESVAKQTYKNVEIVISDDSPDDAVKIAVSAYRDQLNIKYYKNEPALKSPKNWNNAISKSSGDLFMLLHQDDWLHAENALQRYLDIFDKYHEVNFVFCKNIAIQEDGSEMVLQAIPSLLDQLDTKPNHLVRADVIGPPSNVMLRRKVKVQYDENLIWLVDVDYYVRLLKAKHKYYYIPEHLVSIGLHKDQTTNYCRDNLSIILKENILFAYKIGREAFKDIFIYDYYWRLLRNYNIRQQVDIIASGVSKDEILPVFDHIIALQKNVPNRVLKMGAFSKVLMLINYLTR